MGDTSSSTIPVLIASSLKPAKDVRAWEKLGKSLRETSKYSLNFIGFSLKKLEKEDEVHFFSSNLNSRSRLGRLLSGFKFLKVLFTVKPKLLICCTYEFLPLAAFAKRFLEFKLIYDVQENYVANLDLNPSLSASAKKRLGLLIRKMENVAGIDLYLLAEKCYQFEMPEKQPFLVLENKFEGKIIHNNPLQFPARKGYRFLISGTLSEAFGSLDAVQWFVEILQDFPESQLLVIGHTTLPEFEKKLRKAGESILQISWKTSKFPVHHREIIAAYKQVDFVLLPYQNHPAIREKFPTKLFESAALGVPDLHSPNQNWEKFLKPFDGGYAIDFLNLAEATSNFSKALSKTYFTSKPDESILWSSQKSSFLTRVDELLNS